MSTRITFLNGSTDGAKMCATVTVFADNLVEFEEEFMVGLELETSRANLGPGNNISAITLIDNDGMLLYIISCMECPTCMHHFIPYRCNLRNTNHSNSN